MLFCIYFILNVETNDCRKIWQSTQFEFDKRLIFNGYSKVRDGEFSESGTHASCFEYREKHNVLTKAWQERGPGFSGDLLWIHHGSNGSKIKRIIFFIYLNTILSNYVSYSMLQRWTDYMARFIINAYPCPKLEGHLNTVKPLIQKPSFVTT